MNPKNEFEYEPVNELPDTKAPDMVPVPPRVSPTIFPKLSSRMFPKLNLPVKSPAVWVGCGVMILLLALLAYNTVQVRRLRGRMVKMEKLTAEVSKIRSDLQRVEFATSHRSFGVDQTSLRQLNERIDTVERHLASQEMSKKAAPAAAPTSKKSGKTTKKSRRHKG